VAEFGISYFECLVSTTKELVSSFVEYNFLISLQLGTKGALLNLTNFSFEVRPFSSVYYTATICMATSFMVCVLILVAKHQVKLKYLFQLFQGVSISVAIE